MTSQKGAEGSAIALASDRGERTRAHLSFCGSRSFVFEKRKERKEREKEDGICIECSLRVPEGPSRSEHVLCLPRKLTCRDGAVVGREAERHDQEVSHNLACCVEIGGRRVSRMSIQAVNPSGGNGTRPLIPRANGAG